MAELLDSASQRAMMSSPMTSGPENLGADPCSGCGESTAVGTVLFSDRRTLPDGTHLCVICNSKAAAHHGRRLTDDEVRQFIDNGSMAAITWANEHI
jgi:hypothetical protein